MSFVNDNFISDGFSPVNYNDLSLSTFFVTVSSLFKGQFAT